ncbi:MAG: hypothetical protein SGJ20_00540 [Planctomycetota bacterium]|nr:hypothetical protein [Planctomycetota bacterium]
MPSSSQPIRSLESLREYVVTTLCDHDLLELGAFPVTERILIRNGKPCGIFFCLYGPRAVKLTAIWETERNSILFYSSTGERFHKTQLAEITEWEPALL